jgi:hypothetical protein
VLISTAPHSLLWSSSFKHWPRGILPRFMPDHRYAPHAARRLHYPNARRRQRRRGRSKWWWRLHGEQRAPLELRVAAPIAGRPAVRPTMLVHQSSSRPLMFSTAAARSRSAITTALSRFAEHTAAMARRRARLRQSHREHQAAPPWAHVRRGPRADGARPDGKATAPAPRDALARGDHRGTTRGKHSAAAKIGST